MKRLASLIWANKGITVLSAMVLIFVVFCSALAAFTNDQPHDPVQSRPLQETISAQSLLDEVNKRRSEAGVAPLVLDERIMKAAQEKSDDMKIRNYFDHKDPDGKQGYELVFKYIPKESAEYVSENLQGLCARYDTKQVVDKWFASKAHRDAMLDARYDITGFGISLDSSLSSDEYCNGNVVEHFVELHGSSPSVKSANSTDNIVSGQAVSQQANDSVRSEASLSSSVCSPTLVATYKSSMASAYTRSLSSYSNDVTMYRVHNPNTDIAAYSESRKQHYNNYLNDELRQYNEKLKASNCPLLADNENV